MFSKVMNGIGLALLGGFYLYSLGHVLSIRTGGREGGTGETAHIRFAHWQLEGGVRDAFDVLAREYEQAHPGVTIDQMAVPQRSWLNWMVTQLVGQTAPDIIQLGAGTESEVLARSFEPITNAVEQPNPYNAGTPLADVPWRDTFIDGLTRAPSYSSTLLEVFGVPSAMFTMRVYYNRELLRTITGSDAVPKTYAEFVELCQQADAYRTPSGERILPIAGSKYNAPAMIKSLFESQTQRLRLRLANGSDLYTSSEEIAVGYLEGKWSWQDPAIQSGLELSQSVGEYLQPGFLSLGRDDALFYFVQQRALMISSGSWDAASMREQAPFDIGAFSMPVPTRDDPERGEFILGPATESDALVGLSFGICNQSKHPDVALDFLRFLTSEASNRKFTQLSTWLPTVIGVETPSAVQDFAPVLDGYPPGVPLWPEGNYPDFNRVIENNLYRLVGQRGSVDEFVAAVDRESDRALLDDVERAATGTGRNVAGKDISLAAYGVLRDGAPAEASDYENRVSELLESQNEQEAFYYNLRRRLQALPGTDSPTLP